MNYLNAADEVTRSDRMKNDKVYERLRMADRARDATCGGDEEEYIDVLCSWEENIKRTEWQCSM